jgi:hypothetical protein
MSRRRDAPRPYVRIDNDLGADDKFLDICDEHYLAACGLHVLVIGYCDRKRTDGYISSMALRRLAPCASAELIEELVRVGVLKRERNGFSVGNYLDWQLSAEEIEERSHKRSKAAKRRWHGDATCNATCNADTDSDTDKGQEPVVSLGAVGTALEQAKGTLLSSLEQDRASGWVRVYGEQIAIEAISRAVAAGKVNAGYIGAIAKRLADEDWKPGGEEFVSDLDDF